MAINLGNSINVMNTYNNKEMIKQWSSIRPLLNKHIITIKEIPPLYAEKYRFDLWGLFRDVLQIPEDYIYPHILVNGFDSSNCYDGGKLRFGIMDYAGLNPYFKIFNKNIQKNK